MLHIIRSVAGSATTPPTGIPVAHHSLNQGEADRSGAVVPTPGRSITWEHGQSTQNALSHHHQEFSSASTTPVASTSVAAVRWFGLLANDASRDAFDEADVPTSGAAEMEEFLEPSEGQEETDMTPLQRATRSIDNQPVVQVDIDPALTPADKRLSPGMAEESCWRAAEDIWLLEEEQTWFETFLHRICSWVWTLHSSYYLFHLVSHLAPCFLRSIRGETWTLGHFH